MIHPSSTSLSTTFDFSTFSRVCFYSVWTFLTLNFAISVTSPPLLPFLSPSVLCCLTGAFIPLCFSTFLYNLVPMDHSSLVPMDEFSLIFYDFSVPADLSFQTECMLHPRPNISGLMNNSDQNHTPCLVWCVPSQLSLPFQTFMFPLRFLSTIFL